MAEKEYERLALLKESEHETLLDTCEKTFKRIGEHVITSIWYVEDIASEYVKLDHNHTTDTAKLVYKKKDEFTRTELETPVQPGEVEGLDDILSHALKGDRYVSEQRRHDYATPAGLTISVKYTTDMKWHAEVEAPSSLNQEDAQKAVEQFAQDYQLKLLSETEERELYDSLIAKRKAQSNS